MKLSKLAKIGLRKVWKNEASDFTNWLAQEENIKILGEEINIEIAEPHIEAPVGTFSVDILAEEETTGRKIIIENQLEKTDHDHLGKLITYASGLAAEIIIRLVKQARYEHKQAIEWLNEHSDERTNFFLIRIELWQIDKSTPAPKFYILSEPNDWKKRIKTADTLTEMKTLQLEFWRTFKEYASDNSKRLRLQKPHPQHWYTISIGTAKAHISLTINSKEDIIGCEIFIHNDKDLFTELEKKKISIEEKIGKKLDWQFLEDKKGSRIKLSHPGDIKSRASWNSYFKWLLKTAEIFHKIFSKEIKKQSLQ